MSYYYSYYIGYISGGKAYPLGPYSSTGKLKAAVCKSRSFASELHNDFLILGKDQYSDELIKEFQYNDYTGEPYMPEIRFMRVADLPAGEIIMRGYFLIEDVKRYQADKYDFDGFYDVLTPEVYAAMAQNEAMFGKPKPEKDDFGEEYQPKSASDYMYFAYVDRNTEEYESTILREIADALDDYDSNLPKDRTLVVLETEG